MTSSENDLMPPPRDFGDDSRHGSNHSSPEALGRKSAKSRAKAAIRVSLACVQCRSKHIKCDATQPVCGRCALEGKYCYFAKSRRGIRDPKKRNLISDKPPTTTIEDASLHPPSGLTTVSTHREIDVSNVWRPMQIPVNVQREDRSLFNIFFDLFYPSHPVLPPKQFLMKYIETRPDGFRFLLGAIELCGAQYVKIASAKELRETTYATACGPLPFTPESVQGLQILAILAWGDANYVNHVGFANRAMTMAVELGMHRRAFADAILDPMLAESYRRTWWLLKAQCTVRTNVSERMVDIVDVSSDVDFPCSEEWDYQVGNIAQPMSETQYEQEVFLGRRDFASFTLFADCARMQVQVNAIIWGSEDIEQDDERTVQLDDRLCNFIRRVPRSKMELVDPQGRADQLLLVAVGWAHAMRIRLRQLPSRRGLNIREFFPLGPARGPGRCKGQAIKKCGWASHSIDIQSANAIADLFQKYPFHIENFSPMLASIFIRIGTVYLDACVFQGVDSHTFREKINMIIQLLSIHGETWPLSKRMGDDMQAVASEYLTPRDYSSPRSSSMESDTCNVSVATDPNTAVPFLDPMSVGFDVFTDVNSGLNMGEDWPSDAVGWPSSISGYSF
ncbi:hypothetical protein GGR57DRAFT_41008 [Xylariaceae sp. FL1272]|nr:hypothetical protein GGR57DRAFT_41008 [Xylariaceae sp. FL1272]